jgi:hypothetical protein
MYRIKKLKKWANVQQRAVEPWIDYNMHAIKLASIEHSSKTDDENI